MDFVIAFLIVGAAFGIPTYYFEYKRKKEGLEPCFILSLYYSSIIMVVILFIITIIAQFYIHFIK